MKWTKSQQTAIAGVTFVEEVVNKHGSIFRPVHQETDIGIDGYIELVKTENVSGHLIAVQIKSGDSYLSKKNRDEFVIPIDQRHLDYWNRYMLPVVIVCFSPKKKLGAWVSVRDYIAHERYHDRTTIKEIEIPFYQRFDVKALEKGIAGLARRGADERILLKCADDCLSEDPQARRAGFSILQAHPDSRGLKITAKFARSFLMDDDEGTAKSALFILGYAVGRKRWSWNPNNQEEGQVIAYARTLCHDLTETEIRRAVELVDGEYFDGPDGLGERCFDILTCSKNGAIILEKIVLDDSQPMIRRANALYMLSGCDGDLIAERYEALKKDKRLRKLHRWITEHTSL